jgi:mannosyltransferase
MSERSDEPLATGQRLAVAGVVLLGTLVRLPGLSASFYGDEGFSVLRDSNSLLTPTEDRFRPLFFSLLFLWKELGFHGEMGLRALPLVFGIAQIPVAFVLARRLAGFSAGLALAAMVATSPLLIELSQELRMYSLMPLFALAHACILVELTRRAPTGSRTLPLWAALVLVGVAGVYTHFHYWLFVAGIGVYLIAVRRKVPLVASAAALGAMGLFYLPNIPNLVRFEHVGASGPHLASTDLVSALPKLVAAFLVGFDYFSLPQMGMDRAVRLSALDRNVGLTLLVTLLVLIAIPFVVRAHRDRAPREMIVLGHALCTAPVLLAFAAVVLTHKNFLQPKYMAFSAPFALLFLAAAYLEIEKVALRVTVATLCAAVFGVAVVHFNQPELYGRREDWRGAAALLRSEMTDRSVLLLLGAPTLANASPQSLFEYYDPSLALGAQRVALSRPDMSPEELARTLDAMASGRREVYYLWSDIMHNIDDPNDTVLAAARLAFCDERRTQLNPRLAIYRFTTR